MHKKLNWKKKICANNNYTTKFYNAIIFVNWINILCYIFFFLILSPAAKIGSRDKFKKKITLN